MSTTIRTRNFGKVRGFGFEFDVKSVSLGELEAIEIEQFCEFAGQAIVLMNEHLDNDQAAKIFNAFDVAYERVDVPAEPVIFTEVKSKKNEINDIIREFKESMGVIIGKYESNPFVVRSDCVVVGGKYELEFIDFAIFVSYVFAGGVFGWSGEPVPNNARKALEIIRFVYS